MTSRIGWICDQCDTQFEGSDFFGIDCPNCGAEGECLTKICYDPDDYDNDYTILW